MRLKMHVLLGLLIFAVWIPLYFWDKRQNEIRERQENARWAEYEYSNKLRFAQQEVDRRAERALLYDGRELSAEDRQKTIDVLMQLPYEDWQCVGRYSWFLPSDDDTSGIC